MSTSSSSSFVYRASVVVLLSALAVALGLVAWIGARVLLTLFAGVLVGVLLRGVGQWISARTSLSYQWALAAVCTAVVVIGLGFVVFLSTAVSQQFSDMFEQLPQALEQVRSRVEANPLGARLLGSLPQDEDGASSGAATQVFSVASAAVGALGTGVLILFVGLFLAADSDVYRRGLIRLVPPSHRDRIQQVLDDAGDILLRWLLGRIFLMTVIGILTWIGLAVMGVPLALGLGVLAGALSFIPNIGPVLSAIPAMLLAAAQQPVLAAYVALLYLGLQTAESYVLEPYIVRKTADLPAAAVIGFQLLLGTLLGVMGLALATPLFALLTVVVERLYIEDTLGDRSAAAKG